MPWGYENDYGHSGYSSTPAGKNKGGDAEQNTALIEAGREFLKDSINNMVNDDRYSGLRSSLYTDATKDNINDYLAGGDNYEPAVITETLQKMAVQGSMLHNGTQHFRGDWNDQPVGVEDTHRENTVYNYNLSVDNDGDYSAILASLGLPSDYAFQSSDTLNDNLKSKLKNTSHAANKTLDDANKAFEDAKKSGAIDGVGAGKYQKDIDAAEKGVTDAQNEFMDFYHESMVHQLVNEMAYTQHVALSTLSNKNDGVSSEYGQSALYQYAYSTLRLSRLDGEMVDTEHIEQAKAIIKAADPSVDFEKLGKQIDDELVSQVHDDFEELLKNHGRSDDYNDTKWLDEIKDGTYNVDEAFLQRCDSADLSVDLIEQEQEKSANEKLEAYFMAQGTKASAEDIDKAWNELDADTQKKLNENLVGCDNYRGPTYNIPYGTPGESSALSSARDFAKGAVNGNYGDKAHWKYELEKSLKNGDAYQLGVSDSEVSKIADKYLSEDDIKSVFNNSACTEAVLKSYGECVANSAVNDAHKDATEQIWKYLSDDQKKGLEDSLQGPPDGKYVFKLSESDVRDSNGKSIEPDIDALKADYYDELYRYAKAHGDDELAGKAAKNLSNDGVVKADKWLEENKDYDWAKSQFDADYEAPSTKTETKETTAAAKEVEISDAQDAQVPLASSPEGQVPLASSSDGQWTSEKIAALYAEAGDDRTKIAQLDYQMATEAWKGHLSSGDDRKALLGDQYERVQLCAINNIANGSMTAFAQPGTDDYNKLIENLAVDGVAYDICDGKDIDLDDLTKQGLDDAAVLEACDKWQGKDSNQAAVEQIEKSESKPADEKQATGEKSETERKQIEASATTVDNDKPERTDRVSFAAMDTESQEKFFGSACKSYAEKCGWDISSPEAFRAGHYELNEADFSTFMNETAKKQGIIYDMDYLTGFTEEAAKVNGYANTLPKSATIAAYAKFSDKDYNTNYAVDDLCAYAGDLNSMDDKSQDKFFGAACKSYADKYGWDLSSPEAYQAGKYTLDNDNFLACVDEVAKEQNIVYNKETFADSSPDEVAAYAAYAAKDYAGDVSDLFKTYVALPDDSATADTGWNTQGGFSGGGFTVGSASLEATAAKYGQKAAATPATPQTETEMQAGG